MEKKIEFLAGGIKDSGSVVACRNLRRVCIDGVEAMVPAGLPQEVGTAPGVPMYMHRHGDGSESLFFVNGNNIYVLRGGVTSLLATTAKPATAFAGSGTRLMVMAGGRRPCVARYDESAGLWQWLGEMPRLAMPAVMAVGASTLTEVLPERTTRQVYVVADSNLGGDDVATLTRDYLKAYESIGSRARAIGVFFQPVMARVVARTAEGDIVGRTAPVLLTPPVDAAVNCLSSTRILANDGEGYCQVRRGTLSAATYRPTLMWPEMTAAEKAAWDKWAATVEVELSPQYHPADFEALAENRLTRGATNQLTITMALPGTALAGSVPAVMRQRISDSVSRLATTLQSACTKAATTDGWEAVMAETTHAYRSVAATVKAETALIDRLLAKADGNTPADAFSEGFASTAALASGDTVLWGDISRHAPEAPRPLEMASGASGDSPWSGWTSVGYDTVDTAGRQHRTVRQFSHTKKTPSAFSPLLYVADARARELTVSVGGNCLRVELTPTADGMGAMWLADDLQPVDCTLPSGTVPMANAPTPLHLAGTVLASDADSLLEIKSAATISDACVKAMLPAGRALSGWSYTRSSFYVLASSGVFSLTLNATHTASSAVPLDNRTASGAKAWTSTNRGVVMTTGDTLVLLRGQHATTLLSGIDAAAVGWDSTYDELWTLTSGGAVRVYDMNCLERRDSSLTVKNLYSLGGELVLTDGFNVSIAGSETFPASGIAVEWRSRRQADLRQRARVIDIDAAGTGLDLSFVLEADGGAGSVYTATVVSLQVTGELNHTLTTHVAAPRRRYLTLTVRGKVAPDFRFTSATVTMQ